MAHILLYYRKKGLERLIIDVLGIQNLIMNFRTTEIARICEIGWEKDKIDDLIMLILNESQLVCYGSSLRCSDDIIIYDVGNRQVLKIEILLKNQNGNEEKLCDAKFLLTEMYKKHDAIISRSKSMRIDMVWDGAIIISSIYGNDWLSEFRREFEWVSDNNYHLLMDKEISNDRVLNILGRYSEVEWRPANFLPEDFNAY